eukprot:13267998-Ditylum_brightwellii.AAC.1
MPVPAGVPLDDESLGSNSDSEDGVEDTESPERMYPYHATRGRVPAQYQEYPYVVETAKQDLAGDKKYTDIFLASHLSSLPPANTMTSEQMDAQVRQVEALNRQQEVDGYVNGLHPMAFAA